jgi:hypothetical protein
LNRIEIILLLALAVTAVQAGQVLVATPEKGAPEKGDRHLLVLSRQEKMPVTFFVLPLLKSAKILGFCICLY